MEFSSEVCRTFTAMSSRTLLSDHVNIVIWTVELGVKCGELQKSWSFQRRTAVVSMYSACE